MLTQDHYFHYQLTALSTTITCYTTSWMTPIMACVIVLYIVYFSNKWMQSRIMRTNRSADTTQDHQTAELTTVLCAVSKLSHIDCSVYPTVFHFRSHVLMGEVVNNLPCDHAPLIGWKRGHPMFTIIEWWTSHLILNHAIWQYWMVQPFNIARVPCDA